MLKEDIDIILVVVVGTSTVALLLLGFVWFYYYYQKKLYMQQNKHQNALLSAMAQAQENERKNISRDLHDDLGANLSLIKLKMGNIRNKKEFGETDDILDILDHTIHTTRQFSSNLSPLVLEDLGLENALRDLASKVNTRESVEVTFISKGEMESQQPETELNLYRIVQEMLNNSIRHGAASKINISLEFAFGLVELIISDNGRPFNILEFIQNSHAQHKGMGLKNIESRLSMIKGIMKYEYNNGNTTRIILKTAQRERKQ